MGALRRLLLRKPPAKLETWNDLHGRLVNFFTVLRARPDELVRALELTPYARAEYDAARASADDPLEDARRFYVLSCQCRGGAGGNMELGRARGWRYVVDIEARHGNPPSNEFASLDHLRAIAARFKLVQIEQDQALAVIARYDAPEVLHYVDPPYLQAARGDRWARYAHEMTEADHRALAEALGAVRGMWCSPATTVTSTTRCTPAGRWSSGRASPTLAGSAPRCSGSTPPPRRRSIEPDTGSSPSGRLRDRAHDPRR
jgi:DNA adenine methylase